MRADRSIWFLAAFFLVALLAGAAWSVGRPLYQDYTTAQALKPLLAEGSRIVPVRQYPDMRGYARQDYRCFADGLCFYTLDTFRRLYPAYNDLDDDALLSELQARNGRPRASGGGRRRTAMKPATRPPRASQRRPAPTWRHRT